MTHTEAAAARPGDGGAPLQPSQTASGLDIRGGLMLLSICLIWGGAQTAVKIAGEGFSPVFQAAARSLVSSGLVVLWCLGRGIPFFKLDRTLGWGILIGVLFSAEFTSQYVGLAMTDVSRGVLFIYSSPFVAALGAHFLVPAERLNGQRLLGLLLAFAAVCLVFSKGFALPDRTQIAGDLLCLLMGALWGIDMLLVKLSPLSRIEPERVLFYSLAVSVPFLFGASWLMGEPGIIALTPRVLWAFAYTAVLVSFLSYVVFIWLLRAYPAASLGSFMFLSPVIGVMVAGIVLGEPLYPVLLVALGLNALGIWLVNRPARG